jgi:ribosomal protein S18 acetylase RimI-like enzyme
MTLAVALHIWRGIEVTLAVALYLTMVAEGLFRKHIEDFGHMRIEIIQIPVREIETVEDQIVDVYREAFASPPYCMQETDVYQFAGTLPRHTSRKGFRCFVAREVVELKQADRQILGFAYGYIGETGQWWHDLVARGLGREAAKEWLANVFEVTELAVLPAMQGKGIGGKLHDALLHGLLQHTAVLSTAEVETVAVKLYQKRGWITLLHNFYFPGYSMPYRIMGRGLR